jgi:hypothetical protein
MAGVRRSYRFVAFLSLLGYTTLEKGGNLKVKIVDIIAKIFEISSKVTTDLVKALIEAGIPQAHAWLASGETACVFLVLYKGDQPTLLHLTSLDRIELLQDGRVPNLNPFGVFARWGGRPQSAYIVRYQDEDGVSYLAVMQVVLLPDLSGLSSKKPLAPWLQRIKSKIMNGIMKTLTKNEN